MQTAVAWGLFPPSFPEVPAAAAAAAAPFGPWQQKLVPVEVALAHLPCQPQHESSPSAPGVVGGVESGDVELLLQWKEEVGVIGGMESGEVALLLK